MINFPEDSEIQCYVCGNVENDINAVPIRVKGKIVGLILACPGECSKNMNLSKINIDFIGNKEN